MPAGVQISFTAEELLARARAETGIDIGDESAIEPLTILLDSLNRESGLHEAGAKAMADRTTRLLANRLRMQRDFAAHPEIAEEKIEAPIFFCGMGRTGSTKTHRMFSYSGDFNWASYWRVFNPSLLTGDRGEPVEPRIEDAIDYVRWFDAASPELKYAHAFEPREPEEESLILEHSFRTPVFLGWSPVPSYLDWVMRQDMTAQFLHLSDTLKYLQWQGLASGSRRWLLKSPLYTGLEAPLLQVFPDARLVMTHRHPATIIASGLRLMDLFHKPFTDTPNDPEAYTAGQVWAIETHLANRPSIPQILDIHFRELTGPVTPVIRKVYDFLGVELTEASLRRMLDWNDGNPQHKKGKYVYALADYGLTEAMVTEMFASYVGFMEERFGG
jgi:hypothetical protein